MILPSPERLHARTVIAEILATLPPDASGVQRQHALAKGRPQKFNQTHGYGALQQIWEEEVRRAIGPRFLSEKGRNVRRMTRFTVSWSNGVYPRWWIDVVCDACGINPRMKGGCLGCHEMRARLNQIVNSRLAGLAWKDWRKALAADPTVAPIAADWIEEAGLPEVAAILRQHRKEYL